MAKKNSEYWKERMQALEEEQYQRSAKYYKDLQEQYDRARRDMEKDIAVWYQRLADNNGISYAEAKKLLAKNELKEFQWSVKQYIKAGKENAVDKRWMKELENASAKYHISRLEAMKIQLQQHMEQLSAKMEDGMKQFLHTSYEEQYYHTAFEIAKGTEVGSSLMKLDTRRIDTIIAKPWAQDGQAFSDRIWMNKNKLVNNLHTELVQNIIRGTPPKQATDNLAKIMNVGRSQAGRLVMTESAAIASRAQQDCFKELEIEKYEIVATLDNKTSEICQEMDGKVFYRKDYQVGLTAPPFHPWCRSTTVPYFDDEFTEGEQRAARDEDTRETYYVSADMTYKEWKKEFINDKISSQAVENVVDENTSSSYNIIRSAEELQSATEQIRRGLSDYTDNISKWSGKINIDNLLFLDGANGQKEWNCDITLIDTVDDGIIWHEMLHSCSVSYYDAQTYITHAAIEEASVEFLKQQICREKQIVSGFAYKNLTDILQALNNTFNYGSDMEFAKELFNVPLPDRYQWLEGKVDSSLRDMNASFEDYNEVMVFIEALRGGMQHE